MDESDLINLVMRYRVKLEEAREGMMEKIREYIVRGQVPSVQIIIEEYKNAIDNTIKMFMGEIFQNLSKDERKTRIRKARFHQVLLDQKAIVFSNAQTRYITNIVRKIPLIDQTRFMNKCGEILVNEGTNELTTRLRNFWNKRIKRSNLNF